MLMKKLGNKDYWCEIFFLFSFIFGIELIFRAVSSFNIFDYATLRIMLSSLFLAIIIEFLISFIKKKQKRENAIFLVLLVVSLYSWLQAGFRNFLGVYVSVGTSSQAHAVMSYVKEFLASYKPVYYFIWVPLVIFLIYLRSPKKWDKKRKKRIHTKTRVTSLVAAFIVAIIYMSSIYLEFMQNPIQMIPNSTLLFSPTNSSIAINQFGTSVFGILDVKSVMLPRMVINTKSNYEEKDTEDITSELLKEIISEETDPIMNSLNEYFLNQKTHEDNEYTGLFAGKNIIVIMLESVNNIIEHEEYYPNFSKILKHSWYYKNHYSPRNSCATGDNEFSGMTSLYALNTSCTTNTYPENKYFTSIFNRFRDAGYTTSSYHDYDSTFYKRDIYHINMGSEKYYDANDLSIYLDPTTTIEWPSDEEFIEKSSEIFSKTSPFMAWLTTVTPHQPYDGDSTQSDKYFDLFSDTNYPDTLKRYMSKLKVTDDALGKLLTILESKGILDDTVIVLYGDHYPYGLADEEVGMAVDYDVDDFNEIEHTPFVIYNSKLEPHVYYEKTSYINLMPTIANLFGLDYDSRFYMGEDLFAGNFSNRVVFADSSWEDNVARYNASSGVVTYLSDKRYTTKELQSINKTIYEKKEMSKLAITNNYFEYLENKLKEKTKEREEKNEKTNDRGISSQE